LVMASTFALVTYLTEWSLTRKHKTRMKATNKKAYYSCVSITPLKAL
jgi:hypothetical protein